MNGDLAQERDRAKIPAKYKWNLADMYANEVAWRESRDGLAAKIPEFARFQGKLMSSAGALTGALEMMFAFDRELSRLSAYAWLLADEDTRDGRHQGMRQEIEQLRSVFQSHTAFIAPEILQGGKPIVEQFIVAEPRLKIYQLYLKEILRRKPHTLSENEEKILADAAPLASGPSNVYTILTNADFPYPAILLSDGRSVRLDQAAYIYLRTLPERADREKVMSSFFQSLGAFSRTFGATLNGELQKVLFFAKTRKYPSALEMVLDDLNIPVAVYTGLIEGVRRNLPALHRYLRLRKRMLGVDRLHYFDLYAPLVASVNVEYTPQEAQRNVLAAFAPLGPDYTSTIRRAFDERWIDLLPNNGKRSGAYSTHGPYDVHPYVLMNFNSKYADVSVLAHELGHTMHSYLSNKTQPYPLASYPSFVAEVASTFNESLLVDYMLKNSGAPDVRLSLLGNYIENVKGTVFRATQFAEFELRIHELTQKGEPIVGDTLAALYLDITKKYYGQDEELCIVDDYVAHEWSLVPHFYSEFYMFQYATSFTASEALAARVKSGDAAATKRYLAFLNAGGSKYPIELLKDAGVDVTTGGPLELTIGAMNQAMDEMERLLANL